MREIALKSHYSGDLSKEFWEVVNSLKEKDPALHMAVYIAGCALQDHEGRMMQILQDAITRTFGEDQTLPQETNSNPSDPSDGS